MQYIDTYYPTIGGSRENETAEEEVGEFTISLSRMIDLRIVGFDGS